MINSAYVLSGVLGFAMGVLAIHGLYSIFLRKLQSMAEHYSILKAECTRLRALLKHQKQDDKEVPGHMDAKKSTKRECCNDD